MCSSLCLDADSTVSRSGPRRSEGVPIGETLSGRRCATLGILVLIP
jgi:hypothetical protein